MKKALKRRLVISAMASFFILIILLVGSIAVISYRRQEQMSDEFASSLLSDDEPLLQSAPPNWLGYRFTNPSVPGGYYCIHADASGSVTEVERIGILQNDDEDAEALTAQVLLTGRSHGKIGAYKYSVVYEDTGIRLVLTDQTAQVNALYNVIRTGAVVGAVSLLALFIIMQPIAGHAAAAWMRKADQQKQFITNAGHELKTPVAVIMSNAEALELIEGESKYSHNIIEQSKRLDHLIQQLLMMSRVDETVCRDAAMEKVDFSAMLTEDLHTFETRMDARGMTLSAHISTSCMLRGHRESLRQMIHALMDNAVRYGKSDTCIHVELEHLRKQLRLVISNTADHLPDCEPGRLFERFYRADNAHMKKDSSGCGIGLSAALCVARMHRGSILVDYPSADTFRVTVTLPAK